MGKNNTGKNMSSMDILDYSTVYNSYQMLSWINRIY